MASIITKSSGLKLSICITTFNRAPFIGAAIESILSQMTNDCEVVVLDGASNDDTERVVSELTSRCDRLRYVRQETNNGFDRDCDRAVEVASGEYCWLMADDDLLRPGAVMAVLEALRRDLSVIFINVESRDFSLSRVLQSRWLALDSDRVYGPGELDRLFVEMGERLWYVGGVIIKRSIWLARARERYYGSWFIFVGVIFQERLPGESLVIATPFICNRRGNAHTFSPHLAEIIFGNWPSLVGSLAISESAKRTVYGSEPWRSLQRLLLLRGMGFYSVIEYRQWIRPRLRSVREVLTPAIVAAFPGALVNAFLVFYYTVRQHRGGRLQALRESRFYYRNWRVFNRAS